MCVNKDFCCKLKNRNGLILYGYSIGCGWGFVFGRLFRLLCGQKKRALTLLESPLLQRLLGPLTWRPHHAIFLVPENRVRQGHNI